MMFIFLAAQAQTESTLPGFSQTVGMALRMDSELYIQAQSATNGLTLALLIMFLAALSEAVGQSVVLLLNRVKPGRFVPAVALSVASNIIGYLLWSLVIWLVVLLVFGVDVSFQASLIVVGLAYAPQLFAFFELAPYFGNFFSLILTLWTMAATVIAVRYGMGLELWQAAIAGIVSWLAIQAWRRSLGRPIYAVGRWISRSTAGKPLSYTVSDVVAGRLHREEYSSNWSEWRRHQAAAGGNGSGAAETAAVDPLGAPADDAPAAGVAADGVADSTSETLPTEADHVGSRS
jgi:hypothetical protein